MVVFIEGRHFTSHRRFGPDPTVWLGREHGEIEELVVLAADDTAITVMLTSSDPGTDRDRGRLLGSATG